MEQINPNYQESLLGLDVGGTKTAIVEGSMQAEILQRYEIATVATRPFAQTFPLLTERLEDVQQAASKAGRKIVALSVSVGGPLLIARGKLLDPPHLPGWHGIELIDHLAARFPDLPVFVEHDGNAGALAEFYFGIGRGRNDLKHLIFLTFGTGLGAGLIINGEILHGATDTAGEVGHIRLSQQGPIGFGKAGSWEGFASGHGLVQLASEMFPERWTKETAISELVEAMVEDEEDALAVAEEAGKWMGRGMALLIDALNPQVIVLGSLAVVLGERVLAPARKVVLEEALTQAAEACEIVPSVLGKQIGDVASLMAALKTRIRQR